MAPCNRDKVGKCETICFNALPNIKQFVQHIKAIGGLGSVGHEREHFGGLGSVGHERENLGGLGSVGHERGNFI